MSVPVCQRITQQRTPQQGQAMVFVLLTLGIVLLSLTFLYKSGRLTSEKMMLQNAADAGAYSVSLIEARDLNFSSYLNRAKVANEVGFAQFVGLYAWLKNLESANDHMDQLGNYFSVIPYIGSVLKTAVQTTGNILNKFGKGGISALDSILPTVFAFLHGVNQGYGYATAGFHIASMFLSMTTLYDIIGANDEVNNSQAKLSDAGMVSALIHLFTYQTTFTKSYDPSKDDFDTFAALTSDARDRFSKTRNWELIMAILDVDESLTVPFLGTDIYIGSISLYLAMTLSRDGGTELRFNDNRKGESFSWSAADVTLLALDLEASIDLLGFVSGSLDLGENEIELEACVDVLLAEVCVTLFDLPFPTDAPLGTGGAQAATNSAELSASDMYPTDYNGIYEVPPGDNTVPSTAYGGAPINDDAWMGEAANLPFGVIKGTNVPLVTADSNIDGYKGLPAYTDTNTTFTDGKLDKPSETHVFYAPYMLVGVVKDEEDISDNIQPVGRMALESKLADGELGAIAKSEVYFLRPTDVSYFAREDGATEYDNAFNPYWQARLVDTNQYDRMAMLLIQQKTPWVTSVTNFTNPLEEFIDSAVDLFSSI